MTNSTIQEKLGFIALAGTKDVLYENKMVNNRRRRHAIPIVVNNFVAHRGLEIKKSIQLSLF